MNREGMVLSRATEARTAQKSASRAVLGDIANRWVVLAILLIGAAAFILPYYVTVVGALKTSNEYATTSLWSWPQHPSLENFRLVLTNPNVVFSLLLKNTLTVSVLSTVGVILSSSIVAYAFARMDFAGRDRMFLVLLATMMLPYMVTMIPTYVMFSKMGWVNTILPLTVPAFFGGGAFNVFLLRQFYLSLPRELDEAAVLDGANHWVIYRRVVLPLSGPALATVGIFTFMGTWRDLLGPLLYLNDPEKQTLEVGLRSYSALNSERWELMMAASVLVTIPIILLFFLGQRYFVKGIVMSGLK